MDFHVLGPLEVLEGDRPVPLGPPKQRALLALFLVHPNEVLPTDRIIDELWGEEPPAGGGKTLKVHVSNLRKTLEPARAAGEEPHVLLTRSPGYVLRVPAEELDAARFEELVHEAEPLVDADPERATALLGEALSLWHGRPFEDVAYESFAQPEIRRLEEMRLHALEQSIDTKLRLGRHASIVGDLEGLVEQHPLRERLWSHLMVALYRSGRQAEALRAYQSAGVALAEVGIEPSPELRAVEDRILAQDPALLELAAEPGWVRSYELGDPIGEGVAGTTYRALQKTIGREVAIKAISSDLADRPLFVRRFEAEAQIVARLEHPHIVPLYDFWREPGAAFLVMPYLRGGSLARALSGDAWSIDRTLTLVEQIGDALAYAHRRGVVHRDLHPGNVLFDEEGNAYLTDFGIAVVVGSGPSVREVPSAYRSPEQLRSERVTAQSDVFGLGMLTYCALTGGQPDTEMLQIAGVDVAPQIRDVLAAATAERPEDRHATATEYVHALRVAAGPSTATAPQVETARNPYKGLRAFHESDSPDFFGRDPLVNELLDATARYRLVTVVGPSGSGKSSAVRAGLLPVLRAGRVPGSDRWLIADFTPGSDPFEELAVVLLGVGVQSIGGLAEQLRAEPGQAAHLVMELLREGEELLLLVDQFEELWTLTRDEATRAAFLEAVGALATDPRSPAHLVLTLRADFLGRPLAYQGFSELLRPAVVMVGPPSAESYEEAIQLPATGVAMEFEPGLAAEIVHDVVEQPGGLPLMEYALTELFDRREGSQMTRAAYRGSGGVLGALGRRAEELYAGFDEGGRNAARQLFLRLVVVSDEGDTTRRRVPLDELAGLSADPATLRRVLDRYGASRLLTFDRDPQTRTPTVEVAHEALLARWDRLRTWVDDRRDGLIIQRRLHDALVEWEESGGENAYLLAGGRLEQFESWAATGDLILTKDEAAFLAASRQREEAERAGRRRRRRLIMAGFAAAAVVAALLAVVALVNQRMAEDNAAEAQRQEELAIGAAERAEVGERKARARALAVSATASLDVDPELSTLLAIEAVETTASVGQPTVREAEEALHSAVNASRPYRRLPDAGQVAYTPNGMVFLVTESSVRLMDPETGDMLLDLPPSDPRREIFALAVSPDGQRVAYGDWIVNGHPPTVVSVRDVTSGDLQHQLAYGQEPFALAFSPSGTWLAAAGYEGSVWVWDLDRAPRAGWEEQSEHQSTMVGLFPTYRTVSSGIVTGVGFSPDGERIAVPRSGFLEAAALSVATSDWEVRLHGHEADALQAGYLPDGTIVTTSFDETVRLWNGETGELLDTADTDGGSLWSLAISSGGDWIAVGGEGGHISVWEVTSEGLRWSMSLYGHHGRVFSLAFHPTGSALVSSAEDGTRVWDISAVAGGEVAVIDPTSAGAVGFSGDGTRLATSFNGDIDAAVWDAATWGQKALMEGAAISPVAHTDMTAVDGIAFSPDGALVATASWSGGEAPGAVRLWDTASGALVHTLTDTTEARGGIAFSSDGSLIAAATCDRIPATPARVWDTATGELRFEARGGGCGHKVDFSPDARLLAVQSEGGNNNVVIWNLGAGDRVLTLSHSPQWKGAVQFSADGTSLLTAGRDAAARVWDVATGEETMVFLGHVGAVEDAAFSPDGSVLATGGNDGTIRLWEVANGREVLALYPGVSVRSLAWSPDGRQLAEAHGDPSAAGIQVWALDVDELIGIARARLQRGLTPFECETHHIDPCPAA